MPTPIKKVILSKTIDGVITMMYPKSSADIIEYQSGTVADALMNFATAVEDIIKEGGTIDSKIDALYKKIMGITDETTTVNEAYDTLVEVAEYLTEHGSVVQGFTSDISGLKSSVKDLQDAIGAMGGDISAIHQAQVYTVVQEDTTDVDAAIATLGDGITFGNGDVLIIKTSTGVQAGYQYDSDNVPVWAALDGNVSSDNIIFKEDIVLAGSYTQVGNITKGSTATGSIAAAGKSLTAVMQSIFTKELQPSKTEPSVAITLTQAGEHEVGTKITPSYAATFNKGAYTYGPDTGVTVSSWEISDNAGNSASTASGNMPELTVEDTTDYKITAKANHTAGAVALTNLGNETAVKIAAGSKSKVSSSIKGYRKTFFGSKATPVDLTSANIRGLSSEKSSVTSFSVTIVEGAKQVIIAVPTGKTLKSVADVGAFGTDIVGSFVKSTVAVEGANGYTAKDYNVYVYSPAAALGANTYNVTVQ